MTTFTKVSGWNSARLAGEGTGGVATHKPKITCNCVLALTGVVAGVLLGLFISSSSVEAAPTQSVYHEYYGNASLTNLVGARWVLQCNGPKNHQVWGRKSRYYRQTTWPCIGSTPLSETETCFVDGFPAPCP